MKFQALIGRILFSLIFLMSGLSHFGQGAIGYAASQGVPMAGILVPISGILAIVGGLLIVTGYCAKWGAYLICLFLVPVTLMMHKFWTISDPMMAQMQMAMFMKNVSMLGGALIIAYFGAGPMALGCKKKETSK